MSRGLTFETYWPLLFLLVIPYIWWIRRKTWVDLSLKHLKVLGMVRSAIVGLLAIAMMQPVIYRSGAWISVVYLLDVSQSVSPAGIQSAIQWIRRTNGSGKPDHARFIPFGENAAVFDTPDQLETAGVAEDPGRRAIGQNATNIETAIDSALQNFAPHHLKRLVLITDGNENRGHMTSMIQRLRAEGVRVYTLPLEARSNRDVWIESILTPHEVASQEPFSIEVDVYSQTGTSGQVELRHGEKQLGRREVQLVPGLNRVTFETSLPSIKAESGPITLEAEVKAPGDSFPANNTFRQSVLVNGKPKVLYVEGRAQSARYLQAALRMEGFDVTTLPAHQVPASAAGLDTYDAVVLSDVARASLSEQQMQAMATYVRELGGGFILAGGETSFGEDGGYSKTEIERILPITFEARKPHRSVAMIIVLDKSGSMGGPDFAFTKEAAKAPLQLLADSDRFGVVAFDSEFFWAVPFQNAESRVQMARSINAIVPGGETDIYPALEAAYTRLANDSSEVKYVILLSDGHTGRDPFQTLVEKMAQARITVSTVALGAASDRDLLAKIAEWGKGRTYYVTDASHVPQVFSYEAELTTGTTLRESPFTPVVNKNSHILKGIDFETAPVLLGYVATQSKEKSEVLLESTRKDPLLARWQYGLGRTAAFTSDLKDRWAVNWLHWAGYPKFWSQLVRETMRVHDNSDLDLRVVRDGDQARITIDAIQKDGKFRNNLESQLKVTRPDQSVSNVPLHQVGPGSYEARFTLTQKGSHVFRVIGESGGLSKTLAYSYPDEYHFYPADTDLLRAISEETGGRFQPAAQDIFETQGETSASPMPLWPYFAVVALLLYIGDVFLRRVRFD